MDRAAWTHECCFEMYLGCAMVIIISVIITVVVPFRLFVFFGSFFVSFQFQFNLI